MYLHFVLVFAVIALAMAVSAQIVNTATPDRFRCDMCPMRTSAILSSTSSTTVPGLRLSMSGFAGGNICINTYVFDSPKSCWLAAPALLRRTGCASYSVKNQLISNQPHARNSE